MGSEPTDMDLKPGVEYRVRLYRHDEPEPTVVFEGMTTFILSDDLPMVRRLGKRWRIQASCLPGWENITGELPGYRPGDPCIEFGERFILYLLDRGDPAKPYGPDGPSHREALEMALDTWAATEGIDGIRFA
jgi:hypothetical protein